jgi:hypothetical protein
MDDEITAILIEYRDGHIDLREATNRINRLMGWPPLPDHYWPRKGTNDAKPLPLGEAAPPD